MTIRRRVIFHGRVQGVFFRATSAELARGFQLTGFVRNVSDGSVELEAQGAPSRVDSLLNAIRDHFHGHIDREVTTELAPTASATFEIRP